MRNNKLDVLRCGMNYMIVLLHAWAAYQYVDNTTIEFKSWTFVLSHLCWMAIPTFFLISGYLFFNKFSIANWPDKMWRRVKRLSVPYLIWNVSFVMFYLCMARVFPRLAVRVSCYRLDTWAGALSKIVSLTVAPIDGPLWFLRVLLILAVVSPILFFVMRLCKGAIALLLCALWIGAESYLGLARTLGLTAPSYAIMCFVLGGVLALNAKDLLGSFRSWLWLALGLIACTARWCVGATSYSATTFVYICGNILAVLEAPALIALVAHLSVDALSTNKVYGFLRDMSFFAYAGHFLFCSMFLHTLAPAFAFMTTGKFTVLILIFFCLGVPTMAVVYGLCRCFIPKALCLYDGTL